VPAGDADANSARPRPRTRAETKAATRERLIAAAEDVFARKGYAAASVEEIAATAGYTIGALYAHFTSKQQLFLELLSARRARRTGRIVEALRAAAAEGHDRLESLPSLLADFTRRDDTDSALQTEFWLYAVRNPETRAVLAAQIGARLDALEPIFADLLANRHADPNVSPRDVTLVVLALVQGLLRQRRIDPERVPDALIANALRWLIDGIPPG
jgi:AcrR family transcriptional regulator